MQLLPVLPFKEIPLLMQPEMVSATEAYNKFMTRRLAGLDIVNGNNGKGPHTSRFKLLATELRYHAPSKRDEWFAIFTFKEDKTNKHAFAVKCPYGVQNDVLYVREKFKMVGWNFEDGFVTIEYPDGNKLLKQDPDYYDDNRDWILEQYEKLLDKDIIMPGKKTEDKMIFTGKPHPYTPSIHMPKCLSRIHLLRDGYMKCERVQDISRTDAVNEGITIINRPHYKMNGYGLEGTHEKEAATTPENAFRNLWIKINGQRNWDLNPFVWVVSYNMIAGDYDDYIVKFTNPKKKKK